MMVKECLYLGGLSCQSFNMVTPTYIGKLVLKK